MLLKQRYVTGLEKLAFAASQVGVQLFFITSHYSLVFLLYQVSEMQQQLQDLQPELIQTSEETEKLMVKIEKDTVEAEAKKEVSLSLFSYNTFIDFPCDRWLLQMKLLLMKRAAKAKSIKEDCESDLAEAIPALESALSALDTLKPSDITLVKTMKVC